MGVLTTSPRFAAAGAWTPASLSSLRAWYDASDSGSFTYSSGDVVSQWNDLSGGGYHLTQADTAKQPSRSGSINSKSCVLFDGTSDSLLSSSAFSALYRSYTMLAVGRNTAASGQRNLVQGLTLPLTAGDSRIFRTSGGTIDAYAGSFLSSGTSWGTTNAHSIIVVFKAVTDGSIGVDGGSLATGTVGSQDGFTGLRVGAYYDGASEFWQGEICEVVLTANEISAGDVTSWWAYTLAKWGV